MVTREMIQAEIGRWSKIPEDDRGELHEHVRGFLESEIPPGEREVIREGERVDSIDYILESLDSYGT